MCIRDRSTWADNKSLIIPTFILKAYEILQDPINEKIVSWNKEGNGFVIKDMNNFGEYILPVNFKSNNVYSFIRQLNLYDFHKVRNPLNNSQHEWVHPDFLRGNKKNLCNIKRKQQNLPINQISKKISCRDEFKFKDEEESIEKLKNLSSVQSGSVITKEEQIQNIQIKEKEKIQSIQVKQEEEKIQNIESIPNIQAKQEKILNIQPKKIINIEAKDKQTNQIIDALIQQNQSIIDENQAL
eukprot:TRINITY_DN5502_c0_g1_i1.p1 TRINITY_DN5502_c0_g1~~TRINITY_DN5502_c0_g1_i1.p1  ORF type:complete len:274 (+),score=44.16 TRINITY_DN5502_c0_g1_i1:101-823(+)